MSLFLKERIFDVMTAENKLKQVKDIVQTWKDKQGHERCWYYPELFEKLAEVLDVKFTRDTKLPPQEEFEAGCKRFQNSEYTREYRLNSGDPF